MFKLSLPALALMTQTALAEDLPQAISCYRDGANLKDMGLTRKGARPFLTPTGKTPCGYYGNDTPHIFSPAVVAERPVCNP